MKLTTALEGWKLDLPEEMRSAGVETGSGSIWTVLLHLAY
jgi:hypothetical protein